MTQRTETDTEITVVAPGASEQTLAVIREELEQTRLKISEVTSDA